MNNTILLTGGLGFIGSHIILHLLKQNRQIIVIDDLSNSNIDKLQFIYKFMNDNNIHKDFFIFIKKSILDIDNLDNIFNKYIIDCVIHLSAFKSVNQSISNPLDYYDNNVNGTIQLLKIMEKHQCYNFIFSSSATVYGNSNPPYYEDTSTTGLNITNPYGQTKYMVEQILKDVYKSNSKFNIVILRYFNPIGHLYDELKEEPKDIPNNLFPYIVKVYNKELKQLTIFGNNYTNTKDGTCMRDFIHVDDLAEAHSMICLFLLDNHKMLHNQEYLRGLHIFNVGTGNGISVKELIDTFENVNKCKINYKYGEKREGDLSISLAKVDKIYKQLGWKTKYNLKDMVKL